MLRAVLMTSLLLGQVLGGAIHRSAEEIEDFKQFLETANDGKYQEPLSEHLYHLQNAWERSGKLQGDILLTDDQKRNVLEEYKGTRNGIINATKLWPDKTLVYSITKDIYDKDQLAAIFAGFDDISNNSCVKFRKRTNESAYVIITGEEGCYANIGFSGSRQIVNLQPKFPGTSCFRHGIIVHELLHALGFYHMQTTHDRDDYVRIDWEKVQPGAEHHFVKYSALEVSNFGEKYDYGSLMHSSEYEFSVDGSRTIIPLYETTEDVGQYVGMSDADIRRLRALYDC